MNKNTTHKHKFARMTDAKDDAMDKKAGIKEGSKQDIALDKKRGVPEDDAPDAYRTRSKKVK